MIGGAAINHNKDQNGNGGTELPATWLFYLIISIIVIAGYVTVRQNTPSLKESPTVVILTILVAAYLILLYLSPLLIIKQRAYLIYFAAMGTLAFLIGLMTPGAWLAVMLYMCMIGLGISVLWSDIRLVAAVGLLGFALSVVHLVVSWGWHGMWQNIPTLIMIFIFVFIYVVLFTRQTQSLARVQSLLKELEIAHAQLQAYADRVEELTLNQERQRLAQELHDTLIQGLAGLILQLEAVDSHLEKGSADKAQKTAQQAMGLARTTMEEARRAIHALRPGMLEQNSLIDALEQEVDAFRLKTGMTANFYTDGSSPDISPDAAQDILRIVQESLSNVHRHARAKTVEVRLDSNLDSLQIEVVDDGIGFDYDLASQQPTNFGLRGMRERADRIGGVLRISSAPGGGTTVRLEVGLTGDSRIDS